MPKRDARAEIDARIAAAREAVAAALAGQQLALAGQFLESELRAHGSVKAIPDQAMVRVLAKGFADRAAAFPAAAREIALKLHEPGLGADIEAAADRVESLNASPTLAPNIPDLQVLANQPLKTLGPDGPGAVNVGVESPPPPEPEPSPVEMPIPIDDFPQAVRDQAQAEWEARVQPEAQMLIDEAMGILGGGGSGSGISIAGLSSALTAGAVAAASAIGGPVGAGLAALAAYFIPRMLAEIEDWLVGEALEEGGI